MIRRILNVVFNGPWPVTFVMMGVFGGLFALVSADLAMTLHANLGYVLENGLWGLMEGGAAQMLQLVGASYLALAFYVLFKGCLYGLLGRFQKH